MTRPSLASALAGVKRQFEREPPLGFIRLSKTHSLRPVDVAIDKISCYGQARPEFTSGTWIALISRRKLLWVAETFDEVRDLITAAQDRESRA